MGRNARRGVELVWGAVYARPRRGRAGYTFVELATAITIIGLIAAAGTPRFAAAVGARRADATARRLTADLELLRSTARITSQSQSITFDTSGNTYTLTGLPNPDYPGKTYQVVLPGGLYNARFVSLNLGGATTLSFNGFGVPATGGTIVVQAGKTKRTITIDATTGTATWQ